MISQEFFASEILSWMGNGKNWERNSAEHTLVSLLGEMVNRELPPRERISEIQRVAVRHAIADAAEKSSLQSMYVALIPIAIFINSWR